MRHFSQDFMPDRLVAWGGMKPTERGRWLMERMLRFGVTQKMIAAKMGVSASTLNRWYHRKPDSKGKSAKVHGEAFDALEIYLDEWATFIQESSRANAPAGGGFPPERRSGQDRRQPIERRDDPLEGETP